MTIRLIFTLLGVVAAALIPLIVSKFSVSVFWSQTAGIMSGSLLMYLGFAPRQHNTGKVFLPWAIAMMTALLVAFTVHRLLLF